MKLNLIFVIQLLSLFVAQSQSINEGLYINSESQEFVYIHGDSILFRLKNYDAFGTFSLGKGNLKYKTRNTYYYRQCENISSLTSAIKKVDLSDSITAIKIQHNNMTPIVSAHVNAKDLNGNKNNFELIGISDLNGTLLLSADHENTLTNKDVLINIIALDFATSKVINLGKGYMHIIESRVSAEFPFSLLNHGKIFINSENTNEIRINLKSKKNLRKEISTSNLKRVSDVDFSHESPVFLLFNSIQQF